MNLSRASAAVAGVLILIVGLCLGWVGAHFAALRSNAATVAVFNGWRVTCTAAMAKIRACGLARDVVDAKSGQHVATLSLVPGAKGQMLVVTVPYNVLIPQGLGLSFGGGKAKVYPYFTCNGVGCVARIALDDAMRASLRQEQQGQLVFVNANSQSVQVTYPLAGFKRADDTARGFEGSGMRYLLFSAMAGTCILSAAAIAQTAEPKAAAPAETQQFEDWSVRCVSNAAPPCQMIQQAQNKAGKRVSALIIVYLPHQNSYALELVTPLGVSFAKGATLSAGSWTSKVLPFRRCDAAGCIVQAPIDSAALDALGRGPAQGKITLAVAATGKELALPLSLKGFAAARSDMESQTRAKESATPAKPAAAAKPPAAKVAPARR